MKIKWLIFSAQIFHKVYKKPLHYLSIIIKSILKLFSLDAPLLIYIHGGYWQELDRKISSYLVKPFFQNGVRVAVAGYDLAPKGKLKKKNSTRLINFFFFA